MYLPIGTTTEGIVIGMNRSGNFSQYPYPFTGAMDDITLYNRVLNSQEIADYNNLTSAVASVPSLADDVQISPNPARDAVHIHIDRVVKEAMLTVYNSLGQQMLRQPVTGRGDIISTQDWPAGQYMMQFNADGVAGSKKLIVE